ncbi:hypothetical protein O3G_MSEX010873 [Manduca sexta]|uniref:PHD-type domain-containing protein n=1 Tax=Manduca sexta TaxID=7130 RepID=A0A921ZJ67_MANSE|nr:hypothetical protein O3G_MSEX010873 [Manduca sexta]
MSLTWGCCSTEKGPGEEHIICTGCKKVYHFSCLLLPVCKDNKLLRSWKCPQCSENTPKSTRRDSTPTRNTNINRGSKKPTLTSLPEVPPVTSEEVHKIVQNVVRSEFNSMIQQLNETIISLLNKEMQPIKNEIKDISEFMNFMNARLDDIEKEHEAARKLKNEVLEENSCLKRAVADLSARCTTLEQRLNTTEQHLRANNLEIQCVPEGRNENLNSIVKQLCTVVDCRLKDSEITRCTRVAKINTESNRPRSIVVQFASQSSRDQLRASVIKYNKANPSNKLNSSDIGFSCKKTPIYVAEHLSPANKALHAAVRTKAKEKGFKHVWVRGGKIFVRKDDESAYIIIHNMESIGKIK